MNSRASCVVRSYEVRAMSTRPFAYSLLVLAAAACTAPSPEVTDTAAGALDSAATGAGLSEGTDAANAVLAVVNDRNLTIDDYVRRVRISHVSAAAIIATRNGVNGVNESTAEGLGGDDEEFAKLAEIDALPGTDESAFRRLDAFARANGYT